MFEWFSAPVHGRLVSQGCRVILKKATGRPGPPLMIPTSHRILE